ncbi:MAG: hypothetical protein VR68_11190 [Peptococcaceae bacterium BRH_c4a]|nr:MAG: hypothetical protein VR68_11190 [Peptococcaceae bacterium BRH_c4a]
MATIVPFRGLRYNPEIVENLAAVVTPPYDVIDTPAQDRYYEKNPYNIIRLEYGKTFQKDDDNNNRYTRSADAFKAWLEKKVLAPETDPALYLYDHEFTVNGERKTRSGYICAVHLEPYENGIVLPHEQTLPKHKADRLDLMRACRANFSPIFGLYSDPGADVTRTLREAAKGTPDALFTDEKGELHRLWVVRDSESINRVQKLMADKRIFIADGHHRYETALNYKAEREKSSRITTGEEAYNFVMMTLVNLYDPGLVVLPTHRLVKNVKESYLSSLPKKLKGNFTLEEYLFASYKENLTPFLEELSQRSRDDSGQLPHLHVFGIYFGGKLYIASLKDENKLAGLMQADKSPDWQGLDVSVLHSLILEECLGIGEEQRARGDHITYSREEEGALTAVDKGEFQIAFFMNPTLVEEVTNVAANGEKMPQKSTYFYPKLITGLVINSLD